MRGRAGAPRVGLGQKPSLPLGIHGAEPPGPQALRGGPAPNTALPRLRTQGDPATQSTEPGQGTPFPSPCREHPHLTSTCPPSSLRETQNTFRSARCWLGWLPLPRQGCQRASPQPRGVPGPERQAVGSPGLTEEMPQKQIFSPQEATPRPPAAAPTQPGLSTGLQTTCGPAPAPSPASDQ